MIPSNSTCTQHKIFHVVWLSTGYCTMCQHLSVFSSAVNLLITVCIKCYQTLPLKQWDTLLALGYIVTACTCQHALTEAYEELVVWYMHTLDLCEQTFVLAQVTVCSVLRLYLHIRYEVGISDKGGYSLHGVLNMGRPFKNHLFDGKRFYTPVSNLNGRTFQNL